MKTVRLGELSESVRKVLAATGQDESVVIEDENGQARYGIIPYRRPTDEQKQRAWEKLRKLQNKVTRSMEEQGVTEDDVMRVILEDD
ncbi:MAG: hypothetical protein ACC742_14460 [Thermoanaerobaculales bacterium]